MYSCVFVYLSGSHICSRITCSFICFVFFIYGGSLELYAGSVHALCFFIYSDCPCLEAPEQVILCRERAWLYRQKKNNSLNEDGKLKENIIQRLLKNK